MLLCVLREILCPLCSVLASFLFFKTSVNQQIMAICSRSGQFIAAVIQWICSVTFYPYELQLVLLDQVVKFQPEVLIFFPSFKISCDPFIKPALFYCFHYILAVRIDRDLHAW